MGIPPSVPASPGNLLLARLPAEEYERLARRLRPVPLKLRQSLFKAHAPLRQVCFPLEGLISRVTVMENGDAIEVESIGREGMAGLTAFVGGETAPNDVLVQVEGKGLVMEAAALREEAGRDGALRRVLTLYHTFSQVQVSFAVACNGLHTLPRRCCRWLLTMHDRIGADALPVTHEFLAMMLGVRRSSVTEVLQPLQEQGVIENRRGKIVIVDRPGLEAGACECYRRVQEVYTRLLG